MTKHSAIDIARWFVEWAAAEDAELSNLKLQKLLYFAQGHFMDLTGGSPLFEDDMEAWAHGPVVPSVYREYKKFGSGNIQPDDAAFDWDSYEVEVGEFLVACWNTYGAMAAWKLRNITHTQEPWLKHFTPDERFIRIPKDDLKAYFAGKSKITPA
ncbi:type II toxin-antitoxin system antitoxin SocA domain-containing protein [Paenarthrobacter sp.]|uniref:Panacea domain-containing protein n=1 Tax=Paenarthrobacter sp. TaxID=1931993 RepID=UPI0028110D67|nr:type II toxin-antitoxin system antitoxin SocA domain-containing protein [Paenarthrobacter sp.]